MIIKVALLDKNKMYTDRLVKNFQMEYPDQINLSVFSDEEVFEQNINSDSIDIVLLDESMKGVLEIIPKKIPIGRLCQQNDIEKIDGIPAIGKYQKSAELYKAIISLYADNSAKVEFKVKTEGTKIVLFTSAQGGCGVSTTAAAYAICLARHHKKVFYLDLENFGLGGEYFQAEGNSSFSDVIFAIKSNSTNLVLKLRSLLKTDVSKVDFFDTCKNAYDMLELKDNEIPDLINGICQIKEYDYLIIDYSAEISERQLMLMRNHADIIVYVDDGSIEGNTKYTRFCEAIRIIEQREKTSILKKMLLLYNRYNSKSSSQLEKIPTKMLGGINKMVGLRGRELAEKISHIEVLKRISTR